MKDGLPPGADWTVLADTLTSRPALFATFAEKISLDISGADLHAAYLRLYQQACRAVAAHSGESHVEDEISSEGETLISYNMAMTKNTLVICPRLAEGAKIHKDGQVAGTLSLNGTVLAGTALVKNEAEWEALKKDANALSQVLTRIGLSSLV
jgi:ATP adenylyltransferase